MVDLTPYQYGIVLNIYSAVAGVMGLAALLFLMERGEVHRRYRLVYTCSGTICAMACYSYFRLYEQWQLVAGHGHGLALNSFEDGYRYADWLVTVPLSMVAVVRVLDLPPRVERIRTMILSSLAAEMVVFGYIGKSTANTSYELFWWVFAMVPFVIIVVQLFYSCRAAVRGQPDQVRDLVIRARYVLVGSWCVYPVIFLVPIAGYVSTTSFVVTQAIIAVADLTAKVLFAWYLLVIADRKSHLLAFDTDRTPPIRMAPAASLIQSKMPIGKPTPVSN